MEEEVQNSALNQYQMQPLTKMSIDLMHVVLKRDEKSIDPIRTARILSIYMVDQVKQDLDRH